MAIQLKNIGADELFRKIIDGGERDFSLTKLFGGECDLQNHERYAELNNYLLSLGVEGLKAEPISFQGSDFRYVQAKRLYLPFVQGQKANFNGAWFADANLAGADLSGANLKQVTLSEADLSSADLSGANLYIANLIGTNLAGADLSGANLREAALRGAKLEEAKFYKATVSRGPSLTRILDSLELNVVV